MYSLTWLPNINLSSSFSTAMLIYRIRLILSDTIKDFKVIDKAPFILRYKSICMLLLARWDVYMRCTNKDLDCVLSLYQYNLFCFILYDNLSLNPKVEGYSGMIRYLCAIIIISSTTCAKAPAAISQSEQCLNIRHLNCQSRRIKASNQECAST